MNGGNKILTDHILIGSQAPAGEIIFDSYVIGISIENLNASQDDLKYGINEGPKILQQPGDPARQYGGFTSCGIPCYYEGSIKWAFQTNVAPSGLIIITRLSSETKEVQ